jgi:hypothetical protein
MDLRVLILSIIVYLAAFFLYHFTAMKRAHKAYAIMVERLNENNDIDTCLQILDSAIKSKFNSKLAQNFLKVVQTSLLIQLGRFQEVANILINIDRDRLPRDVYELSYTNQVIAHFFLGDMDLAKQIAVKHQDVQNYSRIQILSNFLQGRYEQAKSDWIHLIEHSPGKYIVEKYLLGVMFFEEHDQIKAEYYLDKVLEHSNSTFFYNKANEYKQMIKENKK